MTMRKILLGAASAALLMTLTGCPFSVDNRLNNQGGGTILTATGKVTSERLSTLTPDEIQILADTANGLVEEVDVTLTDDEAAILSELLVANQINGFTDIEDLVRQAEEDPDSIIIPEGVESIAEGENVEDILSQFESLVGDVARRAAEN